MKKSFKTSTFTILFKSALTLGGIGAKNSDPSLYTFVTKAKSEAEALLLLSESRSFTLKNNKGITIKSFRPFSVVRITDSNVDTTVFRTFRGKLEKKHVTVLPSKCPRDLR